MKFRELPYLHWKKLATPAKIARNNQTWFPHKQIFSPKITQNFRTWRFHEISSHFVNKTLHLTMHKMDENE